MTIVINNKKKFQIVNSIFVFGGHCNGWYCYSDDNIVNFNMICDIFNKNKLYFDLICFDACYTSSIEIIYQFHNYTNYLLAHQTYVTGEGFNSPNISKIFNTNNSFKKKILLIALDYIKRTLDEKTHSSISIIDCNNIKDFFILYKKNYDNIRQIMLTSKAKKYYTDMCTKSLNNCMGTKNGCSASICNNMLDLHKILKILGDNEIINQLNKSIYYRTNDILMDPKYFNNRIKFGGINIIINPKRKDYDKYYKSLKFYNDFVI